MKVPTFSRQTTTETGETERIPVQPRRDTDTITKPRTATVTAPTEADRKPVVVGKPVTPVAPAAPARKPRASLLATLGLILSVAGAALVLSGPLAGYGVGVSGLALVISIFGLFATRKWHVAGKTDAMIGIVVSLAAVVLGVLALTGSLYWLGTDVRPVDNLREWLDAQFANRI
ncbi:hypothetical protein [Actinoplanes sp. NPDC051851]|uniref:hypothetical protein n=1 Tax=Actinoplanes sp. NPDC051851 TaxID=3154753 RepID=UPI00343D61CB